MFELNSYVADHIAGVQKAMKDASFKNIGHAAASLRKRAIESIKESPFPSRPGRPPRTRQGALRRALVYAVDPSGESAIIGARYSRFSTAAKYHEFGGKRKASTFPPRPFMGPALEEIAPRLPFEFENSIGAP